MRIAICGNEEQKKELLKKETNSSVEIAWFNEQQQSIENFDAYFDLLFNETDNTKNIFINNVTTFANAVVTTASNLPSNYIRINAWNGFLSRTIIEVAASNEVAKEKASGILNELKWNFIWAPDEPGLIAARIIAMIINEAYFALGENVSTKQEIDVAMKLGTNYPNGPCEWGKKIGLKNIYELLKKLNEKERRYEIAPSLISECEM
jgi:3-hydroxybutyryl-CoA dehydrogenase